MGGGGSPDGVQPQQTPCPPRISGEGVSPVPTSDAEPGFDLSPPSFPPAGQQQPVHMREGRAAGHRRSGTHTVG